MFFLEQSCQHENILFSCRKKPKPSTALQRRFSFFSFSSANSLSGNWKGFFMSLPSFLNGAAMTEERRAASWAPCSRQERSVSPSTPHPSCCLGLLIRQVNPYADDYTLFVQPSAARALESLSAAFGGGPMLKCCMRINTGYLEICCKYVDVKEEVSFSFKKRLSAPRDVKIWLSLAAIFYLFLLPRMKQMLVSCRAF